MNARVPFTLATPSGTPFNYSNFEFDPLPSSFNLLAVGSAQTPPQFNVNVSAIPPTQGTVPQNFKALWSWDATRSAWYFYSPRFEQPGALATNAQFCAANGFEDFGGGTSPAPALSLGLGVGFWVEKF